MNEDHAFYEQMGRTLTAWADVESAVASLFQALNDFVISNAQGAFASSGIGIHIFFASDGWNIRVKMVDAAMKARFRNIKGDPREILRQKKAYLEAWKGLAKRLRSGAADRAKVAHGHLHAAPQDNGIQILGLSPPRGSPKFDANLHCNDLALSRAGIQNLGQEFMTLRDEVRDLVQSIVNSRIVLGAQINALRSVYYLNGINRKPIIDHLSQQFPGTSEYVAWEEI